MEEYTRKQHTVSKTAGNEVNFSAAKAGSIPNSSMEAIMAGRARAGSEMMGHRQDLAPSLNAKMAKAFGMDLSRMQVYRSDAMSGTGTEGLASGNKIVLSADIDLNTTAGQAVLGHEISHIRAQNQGIGMGHTGLYRNAGLEHQADIEGMMAARGQSILGESTGMDMGAGMGGIGGLTPLGAGMSASEGAPMQAKENKKGRSDEGQYSHNPWEALGVKYYATAVGFNEAANKVSGRQDEVDPDEKEAAEPIQNEEKTAVPMQSSPRLRHGGTMMGGYGMNTISKIAMGAATPFLYLGNRLLRLHSYDRLHNRKGKATSLRGQKEMMDAVDNMDNETEVDQDAILDENMERIMEELRDNEQGEA